MHGKGTMDTNTMHAGNMLCMEDFITVIRIQTFIRAAGHAVKHCECLVQVMAIVMDISVFLQPSHVK